MAWRSDIARAAGDRTAAGVRRGVGLQAKWTADAGVITVDVFLQGLVEVAGLIVTLTLGLVHTATPEITDYRVSPNSESLN